MTFEKLNEESKTDESRAEVKGGGERAEERWREREEEESGKYEDEEDEEEEEKEAKFERITLVSSSSPQSGARSPTALRVPMCEFILDDIDVDADEDDLIVVEEVAEDEEAEAK